MRQQLIIPLLLAVMIIGVYQDAIAQTPPDIQWQYNYGGSSSEGGHSISPTADGGYIIAGSTQSNDGDVSGYQGFRDIWVLKLNGAGVLEWQHCLGGSDDDMNTSVIRPAHDGGYILGGTTLSFDGDVQCSAMPTSRIWVTKLNEVGVPQWNTCLGGSQVDGFADILPTSGGYLVFGTTASMDGDASSNNGGQDALLVKLDYEGNTLWSRCYGGERNDGGRGLIETTNGNYLLIAGTGSIDGDLTGQNPYNLEVTSGTTGWLLMVDPVGDILWQRCVGGSNLDFLRGARELSDGSFVVVGSSNSLDGDLPINQGGLDAWVLKLDSNGDLMQSRTFGGSESDEFMNCVVRPDGTTLAAGSTRSSDGDITDQRGISDGWVVLISPAMEIIWQRTMGGSAFDQIEDVTATTDETAAMVGLSLSSDGDLTGNNGETDVWVMKLAPWNDTGVDAALSRFELHLFPNPTTTTLHIQWSGPALRTLEVLDSTGRLVYGPVLRGHVGEAGYALPVSALPAGLYAVRLQSTTGSSVQRFVKE